GPCRTRLRPRHAGAAYRREPQRLGLAARARPWQCDGDARGHPRACEARSDVSEDTAVAAAEWRRTSPVSFIVRAITGLGKMIVPAVAMLFGAQGWDGGGAFIVPAILAMVLISALFTWI